MPNLELGSSKDVQIDPGTTIEQLYKNLGIPIEEIKLAYVNGIYCEPEYILNDGDEIGIFPPIGGGEH